MLLPLSIELLINPVAPFTVFRVDIFMEYLSVDMPVLGDFQSYF